MRRSLKHILLIAVVGLISYSDAFGVPFQFDDFNNISDNPVIRSLGNFLTSGKGFAYNPRRFIGNLTFALNYSIGGLNAAGYHIVNLAVHVATAVLVYFLVILTFKTPYFRGIGQEPAEETNSAVGVVSRQGRDDSTSLIALFSSLLFVAHPIETEAVTYIVQRFASLAAMFYLLSAVLYIQGRLIMERPGAKGSAQQGDTDAVGHGLWSSSSSMSRHSFMSPIVFFILSLCFAVLAMMTKETAFTLPISIVVYEFIFFKSSLRKKMLFLAPLLLTLLIIPISILGTHKPLGEIISDLSEKTRVQTDIPRWDYFVTQLRVIATYVRLLFFPVNQNLDYDYPVYHSLLSPPVLLSSLFLATILGTSAYLLYRSHESVKTYGQEYAGSPLTIHSLRLISFGILWFFITLSVESSFIPIVDVMFEHRVYLPSAGAFIAFSSAAFVLLARFFPEGRTARRVFVGFFSVVILFLCLGTYTRNAVWRSDASLWQDVVEKSPGNARAYNNLGYIYLGEGRVDEAFGYFGAAIRLRPGYADAHDNAGVVFYGKGVFDAAIGQFRKAISLLPDIPDYHHNLGLAYVQKGLFDDGITEFEAAARIRPEDFEIYNDMGVAYRHKGYIDKAIESFSRAIKLNPGYAGAQYNLGLVYQSMGMSGRAAQYFARAHNLAPSQF